MPDPVPGTWDMAVNKVGPRCLQHRRPYPTRMLALALSKDSVGKMMTVAMRESKVRFYK